MWHLQKSMPSLTFKPDTLQNVIFFYSRWNRGIIFFSQIWDVAFFKSETQEVSRKLSRTLFCFDFFFWNWKTVKISNQNISLSSILEKSNISAFTGKNHLIIFFGTESKLTGCKQVPPNKIVFYLLSRNPCFTDPRPLRISFFCLLWKLNFSQTRLQFQCFFTLKN